MTAYAELHCKTNYSFLEGASHADELVPAAAACGYRALAVTDADSLAGVVRAHVAAKEQRLKLIVGVRRPLEEGVVGLAVEFGVGGHAKCPWRNQPPAFRSRNSQNRRPASVSTR